MQNTTPNRTTGADADGFRHVSNLVKGAIESGHAAGELRCGRNTLTVEINGGIQLFTWTNEDTGLSMDVSALEAIKLVDEYWCPEWGA